MNSIGICGYLNKKAPIFSGAFLFFTIYNKLKEPIFYGALIVKE